MKLHQNKWFLIIIILIVQTAVLCCFGSYKKGMHFDECFSYFNTNNSVGRGAYDRSYVTSEDIMKDFYVLPGEGFNYPYVVKLQSYDVHPPVFYLLLHTLCSFIPGVFSMWQGLALNIVYALISSVIIYFIAYEFTHKETVSFVIALSCAINPGTVCNVMYIRMYCLMSLWIVLCIYLHQKMDKYEELNNMPIKYCILSGVLAFLGFLTHYFYLVFLFFIEASFIIPRLFAFKKNIKGIIKYGLSVLLAGILGVLAYPSCLGHVHSGYRGQEVQSYLFDASDIFDRLSFFGGLANRFIFSGFMYIFVLISVLLLVAAYYKKKRGTQTDERVGEFVKFIFIPTVGYFLVSAKCSLLGDEAMMRYQLPIYALIVLSLALIIYGCATFVFKDSKGKVILLCIIGVVFVALNVVGLVKKNVFYLYPEQEKMNEIAQSVSDCDCVYIYNSETSKYLLWNDFKQLSYFDRVFFVNSEDMTPITEKEISESEKLVVFISTLGEKDFDEYKSFILESNENVSSGTKLYDAMYAKVYCFE